MFQSTLSIAQKIARIDDEVRFIRSWLERPLATGAVMPSGKPLARAMAHCVDPNPPGPVIELGPGTGAVTAALVERGIKPSRMVLVEFNPTFCRLLRTRYPEATVVQGDAYRLVALIVGGRALVLGIEDLFQADGRIEPISGSNSKSSSAPCFIRFSGF
jgi:phosphatidylethanolamine/phosphatidyl-N-methylethanolamine N-methyltransferase